MSSIAASKAEEEQLVALEAYLKGALGDIDGAGGSTDEEIMMWIWENTSSSAGSARIVMRCVLETAPTALIEDAATAKASAAKLCKAIERRQTLLKKYNSCPDNAAEQMKRQANCLFEVQRYCATANWPQGLAKMLFYKLYDDDIVFEDAYSVWRENDDDSTPGKLKALAEVKEFLQWLETPNEEDGDGDDDGDD